MSNNMRTRRVAPMRTKDDLNKRLLWATSDVTKEQVVRMTGLQFEEAYHSAVPAIADGTQTDMPLLMAWHSVSVGGGPSDEFIASEHYLYTSLDTSTAAIGDLVFLSATTAGALTLTPTLEPVGWVQSVGNPGKVWFDPVGAKQAAISSNAQKSRPDWDRDWETTIAGGDGDVHVNNSTGNDSTANGTPSLPYATLEAAILDIPHNRVTSGLRNVEIIVANTGTRYELPTHLEAVSQITITCDAPSSPTVSGTVSSVQTTTSPEGMYFTTNLTYSADDTYQGYLIQYTSGKWGWINASFNNGGSDQLYGTQAVNGPAYDTMAPTDTFDLYAPSDLVEIHLVNTANNGLELDQADNFKIRRANITSGASAGKIVIYQSRVNFQDCYFGATIGRILINNGTLLLTNDYLACDGESGFGMVGASGGATIQAKGGTTFDGNLSTTNDTPIMARAGSRVTFSGPVMFRGCTAIELKNGAEIDYNSGYDADVSMYWWEMSGTEPCVRVDAFDGGTPVRGRIPDLHGDTRDAGTSVVVANAPCQLWLGRGSTMAITGKGAGDFSVSVNNGGNLSSGEAFDGSFIRMDRARGSGALGTNYGPHEVTISGGTPTANIDLMYGLAQKFDCSGATASTTVTWDLPDNPTFGEWLTLEIVQGTTLTHTWNAAFVWAGGSAPSLSTTSGQRDILRFYYTGADWVGEAVALNVS